MLQEHTLPNLRLINNEQDIGVILAPPLNAPTLDQYEVGGGENYMEELFIEFCV